MKLAKIPKDAKKLLYLGAVCLFILILSTLVPHQNETPVIASPVATPDGKPPQFVLLAFDGSQSLSMWQETRDFAKEMAVIGKPLFFTYFVSGVYFLADQNKLKYQPPTEAAGTSLIGFANDNQEIAARVRQLNASVAEGHEIASHANGHFNGTDWSLNQWTQELDSFSNLLFKTEQNNPGLVLSEPLAISEQDLVGFRAPLLGANDALDQALANRHYRYDASHVSDDGNWPKKNRYGLWEFPLATIILPNNHQTTISMDYSIFMLQSDGQNTLEHNNADWQQSHDDLLQAYRNYFYARYYGNRAPVFIGHHFSKWNDGLYWEVMKDFAREVCGLADVRCTTHRSLADYLDATTPAPLTATTSAI